MSLQSRFAGKFSPGALPHRREAQSVHVTTGRVRELSASADSFFAAAYELDATVQPWLVDGGVGSLVRLDFVTRNDNGMQRGLCSGLSTLVGECLEALVHACDRVVCPLWGGREVGRIVVRHRAHAASVQMSTP
jgi:hypothetical protein